MTVVPRAVRRNWRLKLAAFGLAVILWAVVQAGPGTASSRQTLQDVPVVAQVSDLDWTLAGDPSPPRVQVTLGGGPDVVLPRTRDNVVVRVPVEAVYGADTVIQLRRDWVRLDGQTGLFVQDINPASVRLSFERTQSALLPVAVRTTGELPEDVALAAPIGLQPQVMRVRGPARRVEGVDSVVLEPLDLSSVDQSGIYKVDVDTASISGLTVTPEEASLGLRLEPSTERVLAGVPVSVDTAAGPVADSVVVTPSTLQVTLRGAQTPVAATDPDRVRAVVPASALQGLEPGYQRRAPIVLMGVPDLVRAFAPVDSVTVRRPPSPRGQGGGAVVSRAGAPVDSVSGGGFR